MNLAALRTELQDSGFPDLTATRADYLINRTYQELCEEEDWPFLLTTVSGAAPKAISDLRTIESVVDNVQQRKLVPADTRALTDVNYSLTTTGTPHSYYVHSGEVKVYPVATNSITVRYWKTPTSLSGDTDTPLVPERFHHALVNGALVYAHLTAGNPELAAAHKAAFDYTKQLMRDALLYPQHDQPSEFVVSTAEHLDA